MVGCARESSNGNADALTGVTSTGPSDGAAATGSVSSGESGGTSPRPAPVPVGPRPTTVPDGGPFYDCGPDYRFFVPPSPSHFIDWTPDGSAIMFDDGTAVMMVDVNGSRLRAIVDANPGFDFSHGFHADVSPDGSRIVYSSCQYPTDGLYATYRHADLGPRRRYPLEGRERYFYEIATVAVDGSERRRLTESDYIDHFPSWSPDGSRIAFTRDGPRYSTFYLYTETVLRPPLGIILKDGSNEQDLIDRGTLKIPVTTPYFVPPAAPAWSADGEQLAVVVYERERPGLAT